MAQFTSSQVEKLEMALGYTTSHTMYTFTHNQLNSNFTQTVVDRGLAILSQLDNIDTLLSESMDTSYVVESRGSKLSYGAHVKHLKSEASRLLRELANLLDVGINYNKYSSSRELLTSYW